MEKLDKRDDSMHIGGSITDELREWAEGNTLRAGMSLRTARDQALAIADRIDAEHERLMQEQPFTIDMVPMTDEHMAEHGWVRLPAQRDREVGSARTWQYTLGAGTCHDEGDPGDFCCSECGVRMFTDTSDTYTMIASDGCTIVKHTNYCPNCGRRCIG